MNYREGEAPGVVASSGLYGDESASKENPPPGKSYDAEGVPVYSDPYKNEHMKLIYILYYTIQNRHHFYFKLVGINI